MFKGFRSRNLASLTSCASPQELGRVGRRILLIFMDFILDKFYVLFGGRPFRTVGQLRRFQSVGFQRKHFSETLFRKVDFSPEALRSEDTAR